MPYKELNFDSSDLSGVELTRQGDEVNVVVPADLHLLWRDPDQ